MVETLAERAEEVWASADLAAMRAGLADRSIDPWPAADRILAAVDLPGRLLVSLG